MHDHEEDVSSFAPKEPRSARRYHNPFVMPEGSDRFGYREEENRIAREDQLRTFQMSLVQRTDAMKPKVPSLLTKTVRQPSSSRTSDSSPREIKPVPPESPRGKKRMRTADFVSEKREIFLLQLIIDRKNKEIRKLEDMARAEEKSMNDAEMRIVETSNEYKMTSAQVEAALARARKSSEAATKKRVELQKELRCEQQTVAIIRSEIIKNEDLIEAYRGYNEFLHSIVPPGRKYEEYFNEPKDLLRYFDDMEQENLFLLDQYQNRQEEIRKSQDFYDSSVVQYDGDYNVMKKKLEELPEVKEEQLELKEGNIRDSEYIDNELVRLHNIIMKTFQKCFGGTANISTMTMLEILESAMEDLYERVEYIKPSFRNEKMAVIDKKRHIQEMRDEADRKEAEQHEKMLKAIARAKKPMVRKTGRPIRGRMLPNMFKKKDEEAERLRMLEKQRIEELLYGPDLD